MMQNCRLLIGYRICVNVATTCYFIHYFVTETLINYCNEIKVKHKITVQITTTGREIAFKISPCLQSLQG